MKLALDSNEMGDECLETVMQGVSAFPRLQKLKLNLARNLLTSEGLASSLALLSELEDLETLDLDAKRTCAALMTRKLYDKCLSDFLPKLKR